MKKRYTTRSCVGITSSVLAKFLYLRTRWM